MQKKVFIFSMVLIGLVSLVYAAWLMRLMDTGHYSAYYIYLRFFLVGWVISSVIIAFIGDTKKIGGFKAFLISLFNPALGAIMVLASESKSGTHLINVINHQAGPTLPKRNNSIKRSSYTLNS